jgi:hypothetical protein
MSALDNDETLEPVPQAEIEAEEQEAAGASAPGRSPGDRLRKRYQRLQEKHTEDIDVPNWSGMLVARYVPITDESFKVAQRALRANAPDAEVGEIAASIETILAACESIWFREDDGQLVPVDESEKSAYQANPIRFDDRLARELEIPYQNDNALVVREIFSVNHQLNVSALLSHAGQLDSWMDQVISETDKEFAGE